MLIAMLLNLLGFALLALGQERYGEQVYGKDRPVAPVTYAQLAIGFITVSLSLLACLANEGISFGCLLWVLSMGASAMVVALTLSWRPQWLRVAWPWHAQHTVSGRRPSNHFH